MSISAFPYQVALISNPYDPQDVYYDQFCGGSILNEYWIATAAHCVEDKAVNEIVVGVGITDLSQPQAGDIFGVDQIIIHPQFNDFTLEFDIALLHLTEPVDFTGARYSATPIPLATSADRTAGWTDPGKMATITGWGSLTPGDPPDFPTVLRAASVPITGVSSYPPFELTPEMMMAGYWQGGVDTCQGDSGGPLVVTNAATGQRLLAGITSWSYGCALAEYPGVYTRISSVEPWVQPTQIAAISPLSHCLNATNWLWTSGGDANWRGEAQVTYDSMLSAQSGKIAGNMESWIETQVMGPGRIDFWWNVSCEEDYDFLSFEVNGLEKVWITGNPGWDHEIITLSAGSQTLRWIYQKDGSVDANADAGWLDLVQYFSPPILTQQPASQHALMGSNVVLRVEAAGSPPPQFQWFFNQSPLLGATESTLLLAQVSSNQAGSYYVKASNSEGTVTSMAALLVVREPLRLEPMSWSTAENELQLLLPAIAGPGEMVLEASSNLVDWESVFTNALPAEATIYGQQMTGESWRFFRAVLY